MNAQDLDRALRRFPALASLPSRDAQDLRARAALRRLDAGTVFLHEGESCGAIALVIEGRIRVRRTASTGREITLYSIEPGETCILTASCLLAGGTYPAEAIVESAVTALLIPGDLFQHLVVANSAMRTFVFSQFGDRIAAMMALVHDVAFARMDRRIAAFLVGESTHEGDGVVRLSHEDIAARLGTARVVVSRVLESFADRAWIALARREVKLVDRGALSAFGNQSD